MEWFCNKFCGEPVKALRCHGSLVKFVANSWGCCRVEVLGQCLWGTLRG